MQCPNCHTANPDSNRFCENCGTGLTRLCASCGHINAPRAKFCGECGGALGQTSAVPLPTTLVLASGLTPPPAVGTTVWAELKQATMLFVDIVSSTEHITGFDPEQAMEHLGPAVVNMCRAIESFGGTVVRTLGDGAMAVFGVPRALEGHALLACEAALAMQASFMHNEQGLRIRVGLHSGLVASDPAGHDVSIGGGVYGHAIHLASRVVGLAEPGGVCLSAACLDLIEDQVVVESIGPQRLKGIAEPVEIYNLLGLREADSRARFQQAGMSAFRGRTAEMKLLLQTLADARRGRGSVIGVAGVPGTGKSRLAFEFSSHCRSEQVPVFEVRTQPYGYATPLLPMLALLRTWVLEMDAQDESPQVRQRITHALSALGTVTPDDHALLCEFFGVLDPNAPVCSLDPRAHRARLVELVRAFVRQKGKETCVILFEDLHWLDPASAALLAALVDEVAATQIVLLLNYRPTYLAPWEGLPHFKSITLGELNGHDTQELVRELLLPRPDLMDALPAIVERSAGNPFFAEELTHSLLEDSSLTPGMGREARSLAAAVHALPVTVQAVLGERIDRLYASQKTLLHICAVIGKEIPLPVLERVAVYLAAQLESGLFSLCEADLLQLLRAVADARRYAFRHPLIQEVAYSTQLKARRIEVHASVALAMASFYRNQLDEYAALIAHHFDAAGQAVEAARYEARAAQWLGATNSTQAMEHWRKARRLLLEQARSVDVDQLRVKVGVGLVYLGWREGMTAAEVRQVIKETVELATEVDSSLIQLLHLIEGRILHGTGEPADHYVEKMQMAISLGAGANDPGREATVHAGLTQAYRWAGLIREGLTASEVVMGNMAHISKQDCDFFGLDMGRWLLVLRSRLLLSSMRLDEARQCLEKMLAMGQQVDPLIQLIDNLAFAELYVASGDSENLQKISAIIEKQVLVSPSPYAKIFGQHALGLSRSYFGLYPQALVSLKESLDLIRSTGVGRELEADVLASLADCHLKTADYLSAQSVAVEAIRVSQQRTNRAAECRALILSAAALLRMSGVSGLDHARVQLDRAKNLIEQTGALMYQAELQAELDLVAQLESQA